MKTLKIYLWIFILSLLSSCAPIYVPNTVNAPLLESGGEFQGGGYIGTNGYDLQAAFSPVDHLGIMANISYDNKSDSANDNYREHFFGEAGMGYYRTITPLLRTGVYGGYGWGYGAAKDTYNFITTSNVVAKGYYHRAFLQPEFGLVNDVFESGIAVRGAYIHFYEFETSAETYKNTNDGLFVEPVIFARVGYKWIKFHAQTGFSYPLTEYGFDRAPFIFNFGITYRFKAWR